MKCTSKTCKLKLLGMVYQDYDSFDKLREAAERLMTHPEVSNIDVYDDERCVGTFERKVIYTERPAMQPHILP